MQGQCGSAGVAADGTALPRQQAERAVASIVPGRARAVRDLRGGAPSGREPRGRPAAPGAASPAAPRAGAPVRALPVVAAPAAGRLIAAGPRTGPRPGTGRAAGAGRERELRYPVGDVVVVSGLPGSGKSTLMRRAVAGLDRQGGPVRRVDSHDTRERWEAALPGWLPYALYRPLARLAHYAGLRRALRSGAGLVVHDCGTLAWVRHWLARHARRRDRALHMVLLDVSPAVARDGQAARGRGVSGYAFRRHRRAVSRLVADAERGRLPRGCASVVLLDRPAADRLRAIGFE